MNSEDPTRIEQRLLGALREISPATRRDWAEADRKLKREARTCWMGAAVALLALVYVFFLMLG